LFFKDDIENFLHHMRINADVNKARLIRINMNYDAVNYHWSHANLKEGIKVGYEGTLKAIEEYESHVQKERQKKIARSPVLDLQASNMQKRATRGSCLAKQYKFTQQKYQ
jgi:hypothetical protein